MYKATLVVVICKNTKTIKYHYNICLLNTSIYVCFKLNLRMPLSRLMGCHSGKCDLRKYGTKMVN